MAEHEVDLTASPEVLAQRNQLAEETCRSLAQAGIPVHRSGPGGGPQEMPGAEVHVESAADGGVLVEWNTGEELTTTAASLLEGGVDPSNPRYALRHYSTVHVCMRDALLKILASAGFTVEEADPHSYGDAVIVHRFHQP
ncbi:hypothetical protein [Streptomyces sp. SYP-A7185]|uniref:hypothetical protein n=1 Tax=Streptomyces sp. SYP-A7185 TaxID=3040076 RepID=UPI0038F6B630